LLVSLVLEGGATWGNIKALNARRGAVPFFRFLRDTKDSDLIVVFGENAAATVGLVVALFALLMSAITGDTHWDGVGSAGVGVVLIGVAIFLAIEVKGLLVGEAADPAIEAAIRGVADGAPGVRSVLRVLTIQQGPGEVMVAMKVELSSGLDTDGVYDTINNFEKLVRVRLPEVRWLFVEPDRQE
jgi:divalent metal cation (Fe/Co/Zn/Cd) transporter